MMSVEMMAECLVGKMADVSAAKMVERAARWAGCLASLMVGLKACALAARWERLSVAWWGVVLVAL